MSDKLICDFCAKSVHILVRIESIYDGLNAICLDCVRGSDQ